MSDRCPNCDRVIHDTHGDVLCCIRCRMMFTPLGARSWVRSKLPMWIPALREMGIA